MASLIAENFDAIGHAATTQTADVTLSILAPATQFAPKGNVFTDSARGTICWEVDRTDEEQTEGVRETGESDTNPQTWSKTFQIEWIATNCVPFHKTRGLRNRWNANREVKIARDGTELEPHVGARLLQLFHD